MATTRLLTLLFSQPDGYLTEERKAAPPDHGFSTFFSETGMLINASCSFLEAVGC